jgi:hypothetical protein
LQRKSLSSWFNYLKTLDGLTINIIWEAVLASRRYSWLAALTIWTSSGDSRWLRMELESTLRSKRTICLQKRLCWVQIHWVMIWIVWSFSTTKQRLSSIQLFPRRTWIWKKNKRCFRKLRRFCLHPQSQNTLTSFRRKM